MSVKKDLGYLRRIDSSSIHVRSDLSPLFADAEAFSNLINDLHSCVEDLEIDLVVSIDALELPRSLCSPDQIQTL